MPLPEPPPLRVQFQLKTGVPPEIAIAILPLLDPKHGLVMVGVTWRLHPIVTLWFAVYVFRGQEWSVRVTEIIQEVGPETRGG